MIYVGIDTGVNTGFSEWDSKKRRLLSVCSLPIHKAMDKVKELYSIHHENMMVRVEDPRQRKWFGTDRVTREAERKKLQGVGSVKRDAVIWEDFLTDLGVRFEMVAPKNNVTKLPQDSFVSYTGWKKPTNEHGRDAAMLVFGY